MDGLIFADFEAAARALLALLQRRLGFDLWMVTRTEGDDWIVLQSADRGYYGIHAGSVFRWADTFCSQMVKGNGPRIAPHSELVPAYAAAPIGRAIRINAYVGMPLVRADGSLFGTLCAIHPSPQPASVVAEQDLLEFLGAMLSTLLQAELKAAEETRRAERLGAEALTDAMTSLYNRRGWERLVACEEDRCRRYGHSAAVVVVDLDELKQVNDTKGHAAGDALIVRAGSALRQASRSLDIVARLGGDEFGILGVECDRAGGKALLERVRTALAAENIKASIGLAMREPSNEIKDAWDKADQLMYEQKRAR
jgi:diguanylate cyclase